jgi:hypothetical protein
MDTGYWSETQKEGDYKEDEDVAGWTILKSVSEREDGMNWIDLTQERDQWRALVNTVMNIRVP